MSSEAPLFHHLFNLTFRISHFAQHVNISAWSCGFTWFLRKIRKTIDISGMIESFSIALCRFLSILYFTVDIFLLETYNKSRNPSDDTAMQCRLGDFGGDVF